MNQNQKVSREMLLNNLATRFPAYGFEIRSENFYESVFIKSKDHEDFKTTIRLDEFPITEEQAESVSGILDGTIQLLKKYKRI
jgi:hypothetical protein